MRTDADLNVKENNEKTEVISSGVGLTSLYRAKKGISLAMLKLGGLCPPLPGRVTVT